MPDSDTGKRQFLRHALATLAYRGGKAVRDAPAGFGDFQAGPTTRTPVAILSHIGDLLGWSLTILRGEKNYNAAEVPSWDDAVERFFTELAALDAYLASDAALAAEPEKLFQAPIADALTHVGQIAMLRRVAGAPIRGENYFLADIATGRVGREQSAPRREFD